MVVIVGKIENVVNEALPGVQDTMAEVRPPRELDARKIRSFVPVLPTFVSYGPVLGGTLVRLQGAYFAPPHGASELISHCHLSLHGEQLVF